MEENKDLLEAVAQALLEHEVLDSEEIDVLIRHEDLSSFREKRDDERRQRQAARTPKSGFTTKIPQEADGSGKVLKPATASAKP